MPRLVLTFRFVLQFTDFTELTQKAIVCTAEVEKLVSKWHGLRRDAIGYEKELAVENYCRFRRAIHKGDIDNANAELVDLVNRVESMCHDEDVYGSGTRSDMNWYINLAQQQLRAERDRQRSST
jgi:hypothetical protein